MILRTIFYSLITVILVSAQGICQDNAANNPLSPEDQQLLAEIFAMESAAGMDTEAQQQVFDSIQRILAIIQQNPQTTPGLLTSVTAKQMALFPDERKAYADAASVYLKLDDMKQMYHLAIQGLSKQSALYKGDSQLLEATIYTMLGQYLLETKQYPRAYDALNKALIKEKKLGLTFYLMGNVCFQLQKFEECQNAYSMAFTTDIDAAYPVDFFYYGIALHRNGLTDKAREVFELGCYRYPNEQGLPLNLGYVLQRQDKLIESYLAFFREQIIFGPQGEFNEAAQFNIEMTADLIRRRKNLREVQIINHINQWDTFMNREQFLQGLEEIKKAIDLFAGYNWTLQFFLQMTYGKLKQYDDAIAVLENMNRHDPHVVINYIELAKTCMLKDDLSGASDYFARARKASPDNWKLRQLEESFKNALMKEQDNQ